jgi:hypothetical protein
MMDKVQKHNSFNTNTPSSESYKNYVNRQLHVLSAQEACELKPFPKKSNGYEWISTSC